MATPASSRMYRASAVSFLYGLLPFVTAAALFIALGGPPLIHPSRLNSMGTSGRKMLLSPQSLGHFGTYANFQHGQSESQMLSHPLRASSSGHAVVEVSQPQNSTSHLPATLEQEMRGEDGAVTLTNSTATADSRRSPEIPAGCLKAAAEDASVARAQVPAVATGGAAAAAQRSFGSITFADMPGLDVPSEWLTSEAEEAAALLAPPGTADLSERSNLLKCLQEPGAARPYTVDDFLHSRPARLRAEIALQSALPRAAHAVTMLVTVTPSRLKMLQGLCKSWPHPISAAVYVTSIVGDEASAAAAANATAAMQHEFDRLEALGKCQMGMVLYSEIVAERDVATLFPINSLRNAALLMARTDLVMLGDADLLAGASTAHSLANATEYAELLRIAECENIVVVPTFETYDAKRAEDAAAGGKEVVMPLWQSKKLKHFLQDGFAAAHSSTDFPRWMTADAPYELAKTDDSFEPWWIMSRKHANLPFYDVRFRGYGKNKVQHLLEAKRRGFRFVVHHRAYLVHRPHAASAAKQQFVKEISSGGAKQPDGDNRTKSSTVEDKSGEAAASRKQLNIFGATERWLSQQLAAGSSYKTLVAPGWEFCRRRLPWWQVYPAQGQALQNVLVTK